MWQVTDFELSTTKRRKTSTRSTDFRFRQKWGIGAGHHFRHHHQLYLDERYPCLRRPSLIYMKLQIVNVQNKLLTVDFRIGLSLEVLIWGPH